MMYRRVFRAAVDPAPVLPPALAHTQTVGVPRPSGRSRRNEQLPEVTYQQELDARQRQERLDADLARRLQLASLLDPDDEPRPHRTADIANMAVRHLLNDDFIHNAANVIMDAFGDANLAVRGGRRQLERRRRSRQSRHGGEDGGVFEPAIRPAET